MKLIKIIPNFFYKDITIGLHLFVDGLGFKVAHNDPKFYILHRDGVTVHLAEDDNYSEYDRPEVRIATDDIDALYAEVKEAHPELLHPNLKAVKLQPWGCREFALLDKTGVCIIVQQ